MGKKADLLAKLIREALERRGARMAADGFYSEDEYKGFLECKELILLVIQEQEDK